MSTRSSTPTTTARSTSPGAPQKTYDDALELVRNAQTLQSAIFGDATIQWPTYIAEIAVHPLTQDPIQATQITEVPWP